MSILIEKYSGLNFEIGDEDYPKKYTLKYSRTVWDHKPADLFMLFDVTLLVEL